MCVVLLRGEQNDFDSIDFGILKKKNVTAGVALCKLGLHRFTRKYGGYMHSGVGGGFFLYM